MTMRLVGRSPRRLSSARAWRPFGAAGYGVVTDQMLRCLVVAVMWLTCAPAQAQREFVEEVRKGNLNDVDLDAPDPVAVKRPVFETPPTPTTKAPLTPTTKPPLTAPTTKPPKPGKNVPPVVVPDPVDVVPVIEGFVVQATDHTAFLEKVSPHFSALQRGDLTRARKALTGLELGALEAAVHGVPGGYGAPALGQALLREAAVASADGRTDDANDLLLLSTQVAPTDLASAIARIAVRFKVEGPIAAVGAIGDVVSSLNAHPVDRGVLLARVGVVLLVSLLLLVAAFVVVVALPTLPILAFDIAMVLPRGAHIGQAGIVGLLVLVAPLALGAGIVPSLLWVLAVSFPYLVRRTRIAVAIVAALAVTMPALVTMTARGIASPSSSAALLADALYDVRGVDAVARLQQLEATGGAIDVLGQVALANAARREGRVDDAIARYRQLVQRHGDLSFVHGGYGIALATAGEDDLALAELGLAAERARGEPGASIVVVTAAFNASVLHHKAGRTEKAQAMLAPIAEGHTDILAVLRRATFRALDEVVSHNRAFVEVLPPRRLLYALEPPDAARSIEAGITGWLWRGLPTTTATALLASFLVVMAVLAGLAGRFKLARACVRCGEPASRRVDGPDVPHDTCAACFHAFLSTKSRVDAGVKLRKENTIRRRNRRRARTVVTLSVWPGIGHLYAGAVARGLAFAVLATTAFVAAVAVSPLWPGPRAVLGLPLWLAASPFALAWAVFLTVGVRSALVVADDERSTR